MDFNDIIPRQDDMAAANAATADLLNGAFAVHSTAMVAEGATTGVALNTAFSIAPVAIELQASFNQAAQLSVAQQPAVTMAMNAPGMG